MSVDKIAQFFQRKGPEAANDNIVVEVYGTGALITTSLEVRAFTKLHEADAYVTEYYQSMARLNDPKQTLLS